MTAPDTRTNISPRKAAAPTASWSALHEPLPAEDFLTNHWRHRSFVSRGDADRFARLLSWPAFNRILAHHWREIYRFRLAQQGQDIDPASYADLDGVPPRVRSRDLTRYLRCGATLSFAAADEVHEPLTRLAESIEASLYGSTQINIYASWRGLHGLDLHRDDEEVFILHLAGRKRWLLYGTAVDGLDRGGLPATSSPPPGAERDLVLAPGDCLYIPRGCYHLAIPMNEPTLHLTVGIKNPREMAIKPRPFFGLPWSATGDGLPPGRDFRIALSVGAHVPAADDLGPTAVRVQHRGRRFKFPRGTKWIIERLTEGVPVPVGAVIDRLSDRLDDGDVRLLLAMLVKHDIVTIAE